MEEKKRVVVKVVRKQPEEKKLKKIKEVRPTTKEGLLEWKANGRKLSRAEDLFLIGIKYYNFAQNIEFMAKWFEKCHKAGIKPNDRFTQLIEEELK